MQASDGDFSACTALHFFALPAVVVDAPAFGGLAAHARRPERGKKKTANDFRGLAVLELFAADLAEDDAVVLAFGLPGGIVVAPLKIKAAFPSGHFRRLSSEPYKYITSTLQFCKVCRALGGSEVDSAPVNRILTDF